MKNIIAINKPKGPTSFAIVAQVRRRTGVKKVGHAGTLDPLASGVLVVAIGREATKKISEVVAKEKEYVADIKLGLTSSTDDEEGTKDIINDRQPDQEEVLKAIKEFIGEIQQVPPQFSAIKIAGRPAYKTARRGEKLELAARPVLIKNIELLEYKYPDLKIRVVTGPGVYIRSLARDLGQALGCGAYMSGLVRTRVGEYRLEDAIAVDSL
ncbi:MAG: tRNA pseudouridine(55) synthase TruB [Patescibacteria group bacterium]|jgi:tRNA pseudouridine55 synthase